ncbi:MAG: cardiolipin synthase [Firmicutes bacterium]|jgi:cardiolipin synthase|nr:cardiolipin synthase [Bacillota bacterium]
MTKIFKLLFHRVFWVAIGIALQAAALIVMIYRFQQYFVYFYGISLFISMVAVIALANGKSKAGYKIAWIIAILLFPIFGGIFYLMFGGSRTGKRTRQKMLSINGKMAEVLDGNQNIIKAIAQENIDAGRQAEYIQKYAYSPPYTNTYIEYFPVGEAKFERMIEELEKAEHFIFLEYFIIEEGVMWDTILEILQRKAAEGVDVRVIYDDIGCILKLPYQYDKKLEAMGIKCAVFNPFRPVLSPRLNNRDHRKILIIDGHTGFTGGINLADEYINAYEKLGHWKDNAVMLKGDAVYSLTVMFLAVWDYLKGIDEDYEQYKPERFGEQKYPVDGYVQPFSDNPLDDEAVGETVYLNLITRAKEYVYITTPYLIIDAEMMTALCNAAKQGIDVRIITPHIPDKWYVHAVTRSNYDQLLQSGVKIYEYTPGFIHAKTFIVDDEYAVIGTINLDYRSLFLHFECGVWMYRSSSIRHIKEDFLETLTKSDEVTWEKYQQVAWYRRIGWALLNLFAPLM